MYSKKGHLEICQNQQNSFQKTKYIIQYLNLLLNRVYRYRYTYKNKFNTSNPKVVKISIFLHPAILQKSSVTVKISFKQ